MAELLKDYISEAYIKDLAKHIPAQIQSDFVHIAGKNLIDLELKDRVRQVAKTWHEVLPGSYSQKIEILSSFVQNYGGLQSFPFTSFIELFGLDDYDTSIAACELFTQYGTAEFAIRPLIEHYPETMNQMLEWSKHENFHVRRLASEGCRPRLPWAKPLKDFIENPDPIIPILENLKHAPEDYVYRSVANNLNDISKDHESIALKLGKKWYGSGANSNWVVKHGLRTLLKQGHPDAFPIFNYEDESLLNIKDFKTTHQKLPIGSSTQLLFTYELNQEVTLPFRIDFEIDFVKANGTTNTKVFSLKDNQLLSGQLQLRKKIDFKQLSTRKIYPGNHIIRLKVNGVPRAECKILITN